MFFSEIYYFIFALCLFLSSVRITYLLIDKSSHLLAKSELLILWVSTFLILLSAFGQILLFSHLSEITNYLLGSILLTIGVHASRFSDLRNYFRYFHDRFFDVISKIPTWKVVLVFSIALLLILIQMRPTNETDSLYELNFFLSWYHESTNPYWNAGLDPAAWYMMFLPSLVITKTDVFFWTISFLSVVLIGLGIYKLGRELKIPGRISWLVAFSVCLFYSLWYPPSGIGTLKQDMIDAAGLILMALAIVKSNNNDSKRLCLILFSIGAIFAFMKTSGFAAVTLGLILAFLFNWKKIMKVKKKTIFYGIVTVVAVLAISGHYYLHKVLEWGNPFYPYKMMFFGHTIGQWIIDISDSSIYSSIHDPQLYQYLLFTPSNIFMAGILFPALITFGYIGTPIIACIQFYRIVSKRSNNRNLLFLAIIIFLMWIVYVFHYGAASSKPGVADLFYVKTLGSIRYTEGVLFLTELFIIYLLWLSRLPENLIIGILGINLVSRLVWNYSQISYEQILNLGYLTIAVPIIIATILLLVRKRVRKKSIMVGIFASILIVSFFTQADIVDTNRAFWVHPWQEVINNIYYEKPSTIFQVYPSGSNGGTKIWTFNYPLWGNRMQHELTGGTYNDLFTFLKANDPKSYPDYIVELCNPNYSCTSDLNDFASKIKKYNYEVKVIEDQAILLKHG